MFLTINNSVNGFLQFLTVVVIFVIVIGITLVATRWMANYQKGAPTASNIEVIDTYRLATNKYIQIVRIGEKYVAIAIGKDEVTVLCELEGSDIVVTAKEQGTALDFAGLLAKFKKNKDNPPE